MAAEDPVLATLAGDRLFLRHFGSDKRAWLAQAAATRVICSIDCASTLASAVAAGSRLLWIEGPVVLSGPATLGAPDDPKQREQERFDALVVEVAGPARNGARAQLEALMERAAPECVLVRPARGGRGVLAP